MKELLKSIVLPLINNPDMLVIDESEDESGTITYTIKVDPEDVGRVIGKQGRIAKAIRTIMKSAAIRNDKRVVVEIE